LNNPYKKQRALSFQRINKTQPIFAIQSALIFSSIPSVLHMSSCPHTTTNACTLVYYLYVHQLPFLLNRLNQTIASIHSTTSKRLTMFYLWVVCWFR